MATPDAVSSAKAIFETNRNWGEWATVVVFVGLVGDIFVLFWFSKDKPKSETWLSFVCMLMIAAGVYGEYSFGHKAAAAASELQQLSEAQVARTELRAAEANQEAGEANRRAVALLAEIQPRYLTATQRDAISAGLRPFSGRGFLISSYWVDAEAASFARQLKSAIGRAGLGTRNETLWTATVDKIGQYPEIITSLFGGGGVPERMPIVVGIQIGGSDEKAVHTFASLMRSLRLGDVTIRPWPKETTPFPDEFNRMPLSVFVGSKPIPEAQ